MRIPVGRCALKGMRNLSMGDAEIVAANHNDPEKMVFVYFRIVLENQLSDPVGKSFFICRFPCPEDVYDENLFLLATALVTPAQVLHPGRSSPFPVLYVRDSRKYLG